MADHSAPERRGARVRLEGLTKRYGPVLAVDGVTLEIEPGEFVTLLGPSGSGKTTTLMIIAGFQEATSGAVYVGDRDITDLPPHRREIGVVFQQYALFPHMRVFDNVAFPLRMRKVGRSELDERVRQALRLVRLEGLERRYPRQLSGGQQQRVALARAVVFAPKIALMDEPLGALDRQLRDQMQLEIKELQRALGITVVYVTHDQTEALVMSDRIAVMRDGRVEQFATPGELYNQPASAFVATFVGESNVLRGRMTRLSGADVELATNAGLVVTGRSDETLAAESTVLATIRPEKITALGPEANKAAATNVLPVTCMSAAYAGETSRYEVETRTGERLVLRIQNGPRARSFSVGESLSVGWSPEDLRVFPDTAAEAPSALPVSLAADSDQ